MTVSATERHRKTLDDNHKFEISAAPETGDQRRSLSPGRYYAENMKQNIC